MAQVGYPATAVIAGWAPLVVTPCVAWYECEGLGGLLDGQ